MEEKEEEEISLVLGFVEGIVLLKRRREVLALMGFDDGFLSCGVCGEGGLWLRVELP